jgi:hypothetical protein
LHQTVEWWTCASVDDDARPACTHCRIEWKTTHRVCGARPPFDSDVDHAGSASGAYRLQAPSRVDGGAGR